MTLDQLVARMNTLAHTPVPASVALPVARDAASSLPRGRGLSVRVSPTPRGAVVSVTGRGARDAAGYLRRTAARDARSARPALRAHIQEVLRG